MVVYGAKIPGPMGLSYPSFSPECDGEMSEVKWVHYLCRDDVECSGISFNDDQRYHNTCYEGMQSYGTLWVGSEAMGLKPYCVQEKLEHVGTIFEVS